MVKVLVLGAGGIIGLSVARRFAVEGYTVFGVTRSEEKGKLLARNEIIPVIGNVQNYSVWEKYANDADIIIEAVADYEDNNTGNVVAKALIELLHKNKSKVVIYTSGTWVHGDTAGRGIVDETTPVTPAELIKWRPAMEDLYIQAGGIVLRAGLLYGKGGSLTAPLFKDLSDGKSVIEGYEKSTWATIHPDDLADAFYLASKNAHVARGQIFNIVAHTESLKDAAQAVADAVGFKGQITFVKPSNLLNECMALCQRVSSHKAKTVLGWVPKQPSFVDGVHTWFASWKAQ